MRYQVKCMKSDNVLFESFLIEECQQWIEWEDIQEFYVYKFITCRGCDEEGYEHYDAHGISTGHWCNDCYESDRYPYRKDRYPTIETHGYGERLSEDY